MFNPMSKYYRFYKGFSYKTKKLTHHNDILYIASLDLIGIMGISKNPKEAESKLRKEIDKYIEKGEARDMIQFKEIKEIIYKNDKGELMFSNMNNKEPLSKETVEAINQQIREGKIIEIGFFKGTLKRRDDI